jgi:hypothetical protein
MLAYQHPLVDREGAYVVNVPSREVGNLPALTLGVKKPSHGMAYLRSPEPAYLPDRYRPWASRAR